MANLGTRIWKRVKNTYTTFKVDCRFSPYYGLLRIADEVVGRIGLKKLSTWAHTKKDQWILRYLKTDLASVIEKYRTMDEVGTHLPDSPIWVCWWAGEESAHPLVKQCIASIRHNAGSHLVQLVTQENFKQYLEIPAYILDKVTSGQMCIANFSDYLRFSLLAKYGGLWLDATIFCSAQLPENLFAAPLFTCKSPERDCGYISRYRWTSFCFGGYSNGLLFRFIHDAFELYWQKNDRSIDYLLVDYLIETAYSEIPAVRTLLDAVSYNNLHRDDLQAAMNAALPASEFENVIQPDTVLYKLSWRETYSEHAVDGTDSIYKWFCTYRSTKE